MNHDGFCAFINRLDERIPKGRGPLSGLTFAVKDNIDVQGVPTGNGSPCYAEWRGVPERDATVVTLLEAAGAACVGKTQMHELAYGLTGINNALRTPRNPFRPNRIPGGSSSGSAVAVAAGLVDFAIGTDTGGSVRVPAAFCRVYGFRPTHGAIPLDGVVSLADSFDTVGIFAPTADILEQAATILLQTGSEDVQTKPGRVIVIDDVALFASPPAISRVNELAEALEQIGYTLERTSGREYLAKALAAQTVLQGVEAYAFHRQWLEAQQPALGSDVSALLETARKRTDLEVQEATQYKREVTEYASELISDNDVLLLPVGPGDPPTPEQLADPDTAMDFRLSILNLSNFASLVGFPVVSVPTPGPNGEGLGVQVIGCAGSDRQLLRLIGSSLGSK